MEAPIQPENHIRTILQKSEWPLSLKEIFPQVAPFLTETLAQDYYSPLRTYVDGQRVYHSTMGESWFTVQVESATRIHAHFDDGRVALLAHGDQNQNYYSKELVGEYNQPEKWAENILNNMPDVEKIGNLYALKSYLDSFPLLRVSNIPGLIKYINICRTFKSERWEEKKSIMSKMCRDCGLHSLWYILHIDNLSSVLRYGILARNLAPDGRTSFANEEIQAHRHTKIPDPRLKFTLHDYVPLFFVDKPPLLYNFLPNPELVIKIQISTDVLLEPGAIFFDMNARSARAKPYFELEQLTRLNWAILHAERWKMGESEETDHINGLYRQAEADIPLRVKPRFFNGIIAPSKETLLKVQGKLQESRSEIRTCIDHQFF